MYFHGYENGGYLLFLGFGLTAGGMILWFRDVIFEGTKNIIINRKTEIIKLSFQTLFSSINMSSSINLEEIKKAYENYCNENLNINNKSFLTSSKNLNSDALENQLGHYLAGLLEGDGHISLPSIGKSKLTRVLNPRIVFTSHINNLGMYAHIQHEYPFRDKGIGRFQNSGNNTIRYIIGDINGIKKFIYLIHNKLRTPKNIRLNQLIKFINSKYSLNIEESQLDLSPLFNNSWFTGMVESDGQSLKGRSKIQGS